MKKSKNIFVALLWVEEDDLIDDQWEELNITDADDALTARSSYLSSFLTGWTGGWTTTTTTDTPNSPWGAIHNDEYLSDNKKRTFSEKNIIYSKFLFLTLIHWKLTHTITKFASTIQILPTFN